MKNLKLLPIFLFAAFVGPSQAMEIEGATITDLKISTHIHNKTREDVIVVKKEVLEKITQAKIFPMSIELTISGDVRNFRVPRIILESNEVKYGETGPSIDITSCLPKNPQSTSANGKVAIVTYKTTKCVVTADDKFFGKKKIKDAELLSAVIKLLSKDDTILISKDVKRWSEYRWQTETKDKLSSSQTQSYPLPTELLTPQFHKFLSESLLMGQIPSESSIDSYQPSLKRPRPDPSANVPLTPVPLIPMQEIPNEPSNDCQSSLERPQPNLYENVVITPVPLIMYIIKRFHLDLFEFIKVLANNNPDLDEALKEYYANRAKEEGAELK